MRDASADRGQEGGARAVVVVEDAPSGIAAAKGNDSYGVAGVSWGAKLLPLKVMDSTAISMCMDNSLPILVFNFRKDGNIEDAVLGQRVGTLIHE